MTNSKETSSTAVGYIRLSTEKQAAGDTGFDKQADRIRKFCAKRGMKLVGIFEDTWSGADPLGAVRRDGLLDALRRARSTGSGLVITEPTRLFRNVEAARDFLATLDVPVYSVRDGRILKAPALLLAIERGEAAVKNIQEGTKTALSRRKDDGVEFATSVVRSRAAQASAKIRTAKSDDIAHQIATVLASDPAYRTLSHKALADLLNRRRIRTGWNRAWTQNSVRDARKKAEALVEEWDDVETWEDESTVVTRAVQPQPVAFPGHGSEASIEEDDDAKLRNLPTFGIV